MTGSQELIWILDRDAEVVAFYLQTLGLRYKIRAFSSIEELKEASENFEGQKPRLLVADPEGFGAAFGELLVGNSAKIASLTSVVIVTASDALNNIRYFLNAGVRDYILKPLRPGELIGKIERALAESENREVVILRGDLDGIQVPELTFRENQLLTLFLNRSDRKVTRDTLFSAIWNKVTVNPKTLDVHLFNLRRKIRPYGYDIVCRDRVFTLERMNVSPDSMESGGHA